MPAEKKKLCSTLTYFFTKKYFGCPLSVWIEGWVINLSDHISCLCACLSSSSGSTNLKIHNYQIILLHSYNLHKEVLVTSVWRVGGVNNRQRWRPSAHGWPNDSPTLLHSTWKLVASTTAWSPPHPPSTPGPPPPKHTHNCQHSRQVWWSRHIFHFHYVIC